MSPEAVPLDQVTPKKLNRMETYLNGLRQEVNGVEGQICLTPNVANAEAVINCHIVESLFELKVGKMLYTTLQIWNAMSAEELVVREKNGMLHSSGKFVKKGSPFCAFNGYASAVTCATKSDLPAKGPDMAMFPGSPLKNNKKSNGVAFPMQNALPEPGAGLSNSQIERVKDEEIFEQYRDRAPGFCRKNKNPPSNAFKLSSYDCLQKENQN